MYNHFACCKPLTLSRAQTQHTGVFAKTVLPISDIIPISNLTCWFSPPLSVEFFKNNPPFFNEKTIFKQPFSHL